MLQCPKNLSRLSYDAVSANVWKSVLVRPRKSDASQGEKIIFSLYHHKKQIRSFPTMYNTWGCSWGQIGEIIFFLQKSGLKHQFWRTRSWIIQLRSGLGPTILKISLTSTGVLKNLEHKLRNELWARRQTSILAESKIFEFFFGADTKKC